MPLYIQLPSDIEEVDVIIAGGGSAGCIIASRLADAGPGLSILLIEGGSDNYQEPDIVHPAFLMSYLHPGNKFMLYYEGAKSKHLAGRGPVVPCGGVLGGGSSVNLMLYSRAQRSDIDAWDTPGWSADEVLGYMKKLETYHGPGSPDSHGLSGPIHVSGGSYCSTRFQDDFIAAVNKVGWPEVRDYNNMDTSTIGVMRAMRYISPDGKRQDTAHAYLHPRLRDGKHPNLHVLVESRVERVVFDGKKAVGVTYRPNPITKLQGVSRTVKARRMVILSCGAIGTPLLLERSGVGSPEVLNRAGVPVVASVPGVGRHYEDHHMMVYSYRSKLAPEETLDGLHAGHLKRDELIHDKADILGWNSMDAQCKLRPSEADISSLGPAFRDAWDKEFRDYPDKPMMIMSLVACYPGDIRTVPAGQYFSIATFSLYPFSRGHVHVTGPNLDDTPDFDLGFFADAHGVDVKKHVWAYKKQREIVRRMAVYAGEVASSHPSFPRHSKAACVETEVPLGHDVPDIEYSAEDDAIIEEWVRGHVDTTWHSLGTCKMAPYEKHGVVDPSLSVYGVEGLKVADLSIPPSNVGANTNNMAMAIGEKASDIFIRELGLV